VGWAAIPVWALDLGRPWGWPWWMMRRGAMPVLSIRPLGLSASPRWCWVPGPATRAPVYRPRWCLGAGGAAAPAYLCRGADRRWLVPAGTAEVPICPRNNRDEPLTFTGQRATRPSSTPRTLTCLYNRGTATSAMPQHAPGAVKPLYRNALSLTRSPWGRNTIRFERSGRDDGAARRGRASPRIAPDGRASGNARLERLWFAPPPRVQDRQ